MSRSSYIFVTLFLSSAVAQLCPPPEILAPCTCAEEDLVINCQWILEEWDIKATFDAASETIDSEVIFNKLEIFDTNLQNIEAEAISSLKFLQIEINGNPQLTFISPQAFNATYSHTVSLSLWNNRLTNKDNEQDIFQFLNKFIKATTIDVALNELTVVPDNAFESLPALNELLISRNAITQVKSFAFTSLTNLTLLSLSANQISPDGINADSFQGMSQIAEVFLLENPIYFLEEGLFKPLVDSANKTSVGGTSCDMDDNCTYDQLICDDRAQWICDEIERYEPKLSGFMCTQEQSIFDYCREQNGHEFVSAMKSESISNMAMCM